MNTLCKQGILLAITVYQHTLSPDHGLAKSLFPGGVCRFDPTCSEYMKTAIDRFGWYGVWLGLKRLARCHPLSTTHHDPVPTL